MAGAGWFHYHRSVPTAIWFNNVDAVLNHHLAGLFGLGSIAWAGHLVHVAGPINKCLDLDLDPLGIQLPHAFSASTDRINELFGGFNINNVLA